MLLSSPVVDTDKKYENYIIRLRLLVRILISLQSNSNIKSYKLPCSTWNVHLQMHKFCVNNIWLKQTLLTWMSNCSHSKLCLLSLSGICQLWRLRGSVEYWGAGMSLFYHFDRKTLYLACQSVRGWFTLCPFRLRWSAGLCCRRPTTSVTRSLCVGWLGSLGRGRSVTQLLIGRVSHIFHILI